MTKENAPPGPASFADVLEHELKAVYQRRRELWGPDHPPSAAPPPPSAGVPSLVDGWPAAREVRPEFLLQQERRKAIEMGLVGVAFSGGGIRSGTCAVGFLQGLAKLRLLRLVDYLSTVSGGGYAGAWLAAWVYREGQKLVRNQAGPMKDLVWRLTAGELADLRAEVERQLTPAQRQVWAVEVARLLPDAQRAEWADRVLWQLTAADPFVRRSTMAIGILAAGVRRLLACPERERRVEKFGQRVETAQRTVTDFLLGWLWSVGPETIAFQDAVRVHRQEVWGARTAFFAAAHGIWPAFVGPAFVAFRADQETAFDATIAAENGAFRVLLDGIQQDARKTNLSQLSVEQHAALKDRHDREQAVLRAQADRLLTAMAQAQLAADFGQMQAVEPPMVLLADAQWQAMTEVTRSLGHSETRAWLAEAVERLPDGQQQTLGGWIALRIRGRSSRAALANVEKQLDPSRVEQAEARRLVSVDDGRRPMLLNQVLDEEPEPLYHLRSYSRYLAPRFGLGSADSWTLVSIYLRNTFANWLILVPAVLAIVFLSRLVVWGYAQENSDWMRVVGTGAFLLAGGLAVRSLGNNRTELSRVAEHPELPPSRRAFSRQRFFWCLVVPLVLASALGVWILGIDPGPERAAVATAGVALVPGPGPFTEAAALTAWDGLDKELFPLRHALYQTINHSWFDGWPTWSKYVVGFAVLTIIPGLYGLLDYRLRIKRWRYGLPFWAAIPLGASVGTFCYLTLRFVVWPLFDAPAALATVGPPLFLLAFTLAGYIELVCFGRMLWENEREWRSRLGANLIMAALGWVGFFGVTLYLPGAIAWLDGKLQGYLTVPMIAGWVATTVAGVFAARSPRTKPGASAPSPALGLLARLGPPVFLIGLLVLVSLLVSAILPGPVVVHALAPLPLRVGPYDGPLILAWAIGCAAFAVLVSLFADVNLFSLHALYANRLIRAYLGASRRKGHWSDDRTRNGRMGEQQTSGGRRWVWGPGRGGAPTAAGGIDRREDLVTGFDLSDDIPLSDLRAEPTATGVALNYRGPYPLFNTSINLVASAELADQDRKAESFALTPDYCGSQATGYARTPTEADRFNLTLGRAMTISGAAVDPNMSIGQSAPQTALMTVFNARLGWWLENPRYPFARSWAAAAPRGGVLWPLYREFLGLTDEKGSDVHLSDGGHFDNSGVYELIRRRCRFIIVGDFAEDLSDASENLAALIRLCRIDFGIRIDIDTTPIRKNADGLSRWHVAIGSIHYEDVDDQALAGTLVFVRSSLTGDEPTDLRQFANTHPDFPHTPTANQFFDEARFESYRALGDHLATSVFGEAAEAFAIETLTDPDSHLRETRQLFAAVRNRWFPPPPQFNQNYAEAGKLCTDLQQSLRKDPNLVRLIGNLYPELSAVDGALYLERAETLAVGQILDVMELAWLGVHLDGYYAHPMNRGWMNIFRRWTSAEIFHELWPVLRGEYSKDFVRFCEKTLNLSPVRAVPVRMDATALASGGDGERHVERLQREFLGEWGGELVAIAARQQERSGRGAGTRSPSPASVLLSPKPLREAAERAVADANSNSQRQPLVWLLKLADHAAKPIPRFEHYPVGFLAIYKVAGGDRCYELVAWIRGAYRSLGLGRSTIEHREGPQNSTKLYEAIREELRQRHPAGDIRTIARYPILDFSGGDRLQQALWTNFFYDYDFRRVRPRRGESFLTVEHTLSDKPGQPLPG